MLWQVLLIALSAGLSPVAAFDDDLADEINTTCAGCHGEFGQGTADGTYPRLAGLRADYLARQLRLFKSRKRLNIPMYPYVIERDMPEEDVLNISNYLSKIELISNLPPIDEATYDPLKRLNPAKRVVNIPLYPGDIKEGKLFYKKECANCHGRQGLGKRKKQNIYPRLVGQHSKYLLRQIEKIREGVRFHDEPDDDAVFKSYSDREIENALSYLSTLDD